MCAKYLHSLCYAINKDVKRQCITYVIENHKITASKIYKYVPLYNNGEVSYNKTTNDLLYEGEIDMINKIR